MKIKFLLTLIVIAGLGATAAFASDNAAEQAKLAKKAKITKAEAEKIAMKKVPDGAVKEAELEEEDGKLIWSFDMTRPGTKNTTEVNVDAVTGKVVNVEVETPKDKAKEEKEDAAKEKEEKKD